MSAPTLRELRVRIVRVPMDPPHRTAGGAIAESPLVLTDAVTDAGVVGHSITFTYTPAAWTGTRPRSSASRWGEPLAASHALRSRKRPLTASC